MSVPSVSVVIPTRNGAATLPGVLDALARQHVERPFEIVAVDSASVDGTPDLLRGRVDRLVSIDAETFDHGATRNLGVERSSGDLVVLLVQDAVPASEDWLTGLTAPFAADPRLAGAFARQLPSPTASALARHYLARWSGAGTEPRVSSLAGASELMALEPIARMDRCAFDNVCSCIRRSVWRDHPFPRTPIAEDLAWARDVLLAGFRVAYVPGAAVVHSHDRSAREELARTCRLHRRLYELFEIETVPTVAALARAIASSTILHWRCHRESPQSLSAWRALGLAVAWPLGQYLGPRSAMRESPAPARPTRTA